MRGIEYYAQAIKQALLFLALLGFMPACICAGPEESLEIGPENIVLTDLGPDTAEDIEGGTQGAVYQEAYKRAQAEITIENAAEKLDAMSKAVRREYEELRHP